MKREHFNASTHEAYVLKLKKRNPKVRCVANYQRSGIKVLHECVVCKHRWKTTPDNALAGCGCPACNPHHKRMTPAEFKRKLKLVHPTVKVLTPYVKSTVKITFRCAKGHTYSTYPRFLLYSSKTRCTECALLEARNRFSLGDAAFRQRVRKRYRGALQLSAKTPYVNQSTVMRARCIAKKHVFERPASWFRVQPRTHPCPICHKRWNQSKIALACIKAIARKTQLRFAHAENATEHRVIVDGKQYHLDAYNKRLNLAIEFHGDYYHGVSDKRSTAYRDTLRRNEQLRRVVNLIVVWEYEYKSDKRATIARCVRRVERLKTLLR
jgi:hypothetical protein